MTKYNRIMERVCVTPEMESRLVNAIHHAPRRTVQAGGWYKPLCAIAACAVLAVFGTWYVSYDPDTGGNSQIVQSGGMVECASVDELQDRLTFPLALPQALPEGYAFASAADQFGMAVVVYESGSEQIKYYMAQGADAFPQTAHTEQRALGVWGTLYYDEGVGWSVDWTDGLYSYSLFSTKPLEDAEWRGMIDSVS